MDVCESLINWLDTFRVDHSRKTIEDLSDGIALAQILHQICPEFFSDIWFMSINPDAASNWRLKVSNLKKILKAVLDYHSETILRPIPDTHSIDVQAIVEHNDVKELGRLLQLILGCAVNCENKKEYIQRILGLEESVQVAVMKAIQGLTDLLNEVPIVDEGLAEQLRKTTEDLTMLSEQRDVYAQRCHDLDQQVMLLNEERASLQTENERLSERLNQAESLDNPDTPAGRRYQTLQRQNEQVHEELYKTESAKDDLRIRIEIMEKEFYEVQQKSEELTAVANESRQLRDEVYILRNVAEKVTKYEATIATYKKKLEDMADLKGQVKLLEEKTTTYMQQNLDLEEEVKRSSALKPQLDAYKRQLQDIQLKNSEETKRADRAEFESKRAQEKLSALQREKDRLEEERDGLKEMNDDLRCSQLQPTDQPDGSVLGGGLELMNLPADVRERFLRLQHENKMLQRDRSSTADDPLLQSMLDDANARIYDLECEVRATNQRILELDAQIEDMNEVQSKILTTDDRASSEVKKRLTEQTGRCRALEEDLQASKNLSDELEIKVQTHTQDLIRLQETLTRKESDMKEMEEKYKRYLSKAKSVIKQLDPKYNNSNSAMSTVELQSLKMELQEKDQYIQKLERDNMHEKQQREMEESLITSAWYNLGASVNRKAAEDRLSAGSPAQQPFLARQRLAHTRRTSSMAGTVSQPNTAR